MNKTLLAQQVNRFLQISVQNADLSDDKAMEIADLYPEWTVNKSYSENEIIKYGVNTDGETQLYRVIQSHNSQSNWMPDSAPSLYKKIGFADNGIPIWTQPLGVTDAYMTGDIVSFGGQLWASVVDSNVWQPGIYGWENAEMR